MSTGFEFLPRSSRRIHADLRFPAAFILLALGLSVGAWWLLGTTRHLQQEYRQKSAGLTTRKQELLQDALALIPAPDTLAAMEARINRHNVACIGPRFPWSRLLSILEQALPEDSVISSILNSRTGRPQFASGDREFALTVVVADVDVANTFYSRLSAITSFQNLSFTPKNEVTIQGRRGTAIEISFRFQEGD
ncbi:MAG TPA: hypothetical protein PKO06_14105 [Candidatus Ozemobacteraceae bacterium]|nr:hypothetical protein [Candidatus Ozemobacteraceae bacterium]